MFLLIYLYEERLLSKPNSQSSRLSKGITIYVDDFEGSQSTIDMRSAYGFCLLHQIEMLG
jgi:hypothetical protein